MICSGRPKMGFAKPVAPYLWQRIDSTRNDSSPMQGMVPSPGAWHELVRHIAQTATEGGTSCVRVTDVGDLRKGWILIRQGLNSFGMCKKTKLQPWTWQT